jgi:hypothetical protein
VGPGTSNDVFERGNSDVGFANAGQAQKQEALVDRRKVIHKPAGELNRPFQRIVVRLKIVESTVLVAPRDTRFIEPLSSDRFAPAVASDDTPHAAVLDRLPAGVFADGTHVR